MGSIIVSLPLWSMCLQQRCRSCHRRGQTSCHCDAEHHAWAGSPSSRWIQTEPSSAAWGNLEIDTSSPFMSPLFSTRRSSSEHLGCKAQQRPVQRKEVQRCPAVVKNRSSGLGNITEHDTLNTSDSGETVSGCKLSYSATHLWHF